MKYPGGKAYQSKHIAPIILDYGSGCHTYLEPFLGVGSVFVRVAPSFKTKLAGDNCLDIVLLMQETRDGKMFPENISREKYEALRHGEPSSMRAFAGFGSSFGGKFFGGYAGATPPRPKNAMGDNPARAASRRLSRMTPYLAGADIRHADFRSWSPGHGWLVYADPPYSETTNGYGDKDDCSDFWDVASSWVENGAVVLVSELSAPSGWSAVWSRPAAGNMQRGGSVANTRTEYLFVKN